MSDSASPSGALAVPPPARDGAGERAILSLIEEGSGLLPIPRRGEIAKAVLHHLDLPRHVAGEQGDFASQAFLGAHGDIVPRENSLGLHQRQERLHDLAAEALDAGAEELHDEPPVVPIADK